ncbi:MAG TPA: hypothetical protein VMV87_15740 [Burkholderiales bacterium]|nr:hypothetical protein [Burkholderiales bacterium]
MPETAYAIWLIFDERDRVNLVTRGHAGVAKASRALRTSKTRDVPAALMGKLPLECKALALSVHSDFDTIAMDAEWTGLPKRAPGQLSGVLQECTACQERYRLTGTARN